MAMGRGKHQITKIKAELKALTKEAVAVERASKELARKDFWKDFPTWLKERAGKLIDNVNILELTAVIALTPIVKGTIDKSPEITDWYQKLIFVGSPIIGWLFGQVVDPQDVKLEENMSWVVAFGVSYLVVHNFGAIMSAGESIGGWVAKIFTVA